MSAQDTTVGVQRAWLGDVPTRKQASRSKCQARVAKLK